MKKRIRLIITIAVAMLVVCLLAWRFWPHSSTALMSIDKNAVTNFSGNAMVQCFENGQNYTDAYQIGNPEQQGNEPADIAEILATSRYQQDFRNLLPWGVDSVGSDKNYDGRTVLLSFEIQNTEKECVEIMFLSSSIIAVGTDDESGLRIYHPTNKKTFDALVEYFQIYGTKQ